MAFIALPGGASVAAEGCTPHGTAAGKKVDATTVGYELAVLDLQGKSEAEIDTIMNSDWCLAKVSTVARPAGAKSGTVSVNGVLAQEGHVSPLSSTGFENSDDVTWLIETIYRQTGGATRHDFATEKYSWINHDYHYDASSLTNCPWSKAEGGQDGMALAVDHGNFRTSSASLQVYGDPALDTYDNDYHIVTIGVAGTVSSLGVGWRWQDNTRYTYDTAGGGGACAAGEGTHYMDLDDYRGIMTWEFYSANGSCYSNVYVQGSLEHTWDNSGVQSISLGVGPGNNFVGFNYGVTNSSYFPSQSYGSDNSVDPLC